MFAAASGLALTLALSTGANDPLSQSTRMPAEAVITLAAASTEVPAEGPLGGFNRPAPSPKWMLDRPMSRPAALPAMYASLGALQALDIYSTRKAIGSGAHEANPVMRASSGSATAMLAVKAASTAASIFFTERAWKKNRKGAMILMAVANGVTAAVVANNLKNTK